MVAHTHPQGPQRSKGKRARNGFGEVGKEVAFRYRSAHPHGKVTGVAKQGKTKDTTMFNVMPDAKDRHPGEKLPVHRRGNKL